MHNLFLLLGTIIGAGIFSLPIALSQTSFLIFLGLVVLLAFIMAKVNWFYYQIVKNSRERCQLGSYVRQILGDNWSIVAIVLLLFSTVGALLAYLILAGNFLSAITPFSSTQATWLFYLLVFLLLYFGGKKLEAFDVFVTVIKIILLTILVALTFSPQTLFAKLFFVSGALSSKTFLLTYGSVLFALTGYSIVPELKKNGNLKQSINLAQIISALFYLFFSLNFFAFAQNGAFFFESSLIKVLFNLTGLFTVLTPYLMLSWVGYDLFDKDLGFPKKEALILILILPLLFYLLGLHDFLTVISVSGGVFLGGIGLLILQMYKKKFPQKQPILLRIFQIVFVIGALAEIISLF